MGKNFIIYVKSFKSGVPIIYTIKDNILIDKGRPVDILSLKYQLDYSFEYDIICNIGKCSDKEIISKIYRAAPELLL